MHPCAISQDADTFTAAPDDAIHLHRRIAPRYQRCWRGIARPMRNVFVPQVGTQCSGSCPQTQVEDPRMQGNRTSIRLAVHWSLGFTKGRSLASTVTSSSLRLPGVISSGSPINRFYIFRARISIHECPNCGLGRKGARRCHLLTVLNPLRPKPPVANPNRLSRTILGANDSILSRCR